MLRYRLIFGPIMVLLLAGVIYLDNRVDQIPLQDTAMQQWLQGRAYLPAGLVMLGLFLALIPFGARELCVIFRAKGIEADRLMLTLAGMLGCSIIYIMPARIDSQLSVAILTTVMMGLFLLSLVRHSWRHRTQGAVGAAGATMFALMYMGVLPGFFILIRRWHSAWIILGIILITKACDIGAYFTGRALGKHKLIPWLSPAKTWEGLTGGVTASVLAALALGSLANHLDIAGHYDWGRQFVATPLPAWLLVVAGVLLALVGHMGDLVASLFKRDAGIKDSGAAVPGFGGLLDIVDSPLAIAPVAYWILAVLKALN